MTEANVSRRHTKDSTLAPVHGVAKYVQQIGHLRAVMLLITELIKDSKGHAVSYTHLTLPTKA